jgi:uncharacterized protein (DUF1697 family)
MKTWIALFKGINVGGNNKILMKDLVREFGALGFSDVRTYIQSGNVVFCDTNNSAPKLSAIIAEMIQSEFSVKTSVMILGVAELSRALEANPFPELDTDEQAKRMHLYFLSHPSSQFDVDRLTAIKKSDERWAFIDNVFYLHTPSGAGDSKLAQQVEKIVGVPATARNLRTVRTLVDMTANSSF